MVSQPSSGLKLPTLEEARSLLASSVKGRSALAMLDEIQKQTSSPAAESRARSQAYLVAATRATFTVANLRNADAADVTSVLNDSLATPTVVGETVRYVLSDAARRATFEAWTAAPELKHALAQAREQTDPETRFLAMLAEGNADFDLSSLSPPEMAAAAQAGGKILSFTPAIAPLVHEMRRRLDLEEVIGPLKLLIGCRGPVGEGGGEDDFVGREEELERLYAHVGVLPPATLMDRLTRITRKIGETFTGRPNGALVVHGIGGMGKSSLVAKFVLDHAAQGPHRLPFVYLDFDRTTIANGGVLNLLIEMARQAGLQMRQDGKDDLVGAASLTEELRALRAALRAQLSSATAVDATEHVHRFREIADRLPASDRPFLLVLDTLERVQNLGASEMNRLIRLLADLGLFDGSWPRLRVVVCSRIDARELRPDGDRPAAIDLGPFSQTGAEQLAGKLLESVWPGRDITRAWRRAIGKASNGYPLIVRILVEHVARATETDNAKLIEEIESAKGHAARVATVLYKRFADRIAVSGGADTIKVVACLRIITKPLLAAVLSGTDAQIKAADVDRIFADLSSDRSLWAEIAPDRLRWRSDLRGLLLQCVREEEPQRLQAVARIAFEFSRAGSAIDQWAADAIYYCLLTGQDVAAADRFWRQSADLRRQLAGAADDFPPGGAANAYLAIRAAARLPTVVEIETLPPAIAWRLAFSAEPGFARPGDKVVEMRIAPLWKIATASQGGDAQFRAQRFGLAVKIGAWMNARELFDEAFIDDPVGREAILQLGVRSDLGKDRDEILSRCLEHGVDEIPAAQRTEALARRLAAARAIGHVKLARQFDEEIDKLPRRWQASRNPDPIRTIGTFGDHAADWAMETFLTSRSLKSVSVGEYRLLRDACRQFDQPLAERLEQAFSDIGQRENSARASLESQRADVIADPVALAAIVDALHSIHGDWAQDDRRRFFARFFALRDPDWAEPIGYTLTRLAVSPNELRSTMVQTLRDLASEGAAGVDFAERAGRSSLSIDPITFLRTIDESSLLMEYLERLQGHLEKSSASWLTQSANSLRSWWSNDDGDAAERAARQLHQLVDDCRRWRRFKQQTLRADAAPA